MKKEKITRGWWVSACLWAATHVCRNWPYAPRTLKRTHARTDTTPGWWLVGSNFRLQELAVRITHHAHSNAHTHTQTPTHTYTCTHAMRKYSWVMGLSMLFVSGNMRLQELAVCAQTSRVSNVSSVWMWSLFEISFCRGSAWRMHPLLMYFKRVYCECMRCCLLSKTQYTQIMHFSHKKWLINARFTLSFSHRKKPFSTQCYASLTLLLSITTWPSRFIIPLKTRDPRTPTLTLRILF